MQLDERLYWALALGILILRGPGPFSLDRLVEEAFRRAARREAPKDESLPHVVVVGGGFGGIAAARGVAGAACRVTLVVLLAGETLLARTVLWAAGGQRWPRGGGAGSLRRCERCDLCHRGRRREPRLERAVGSGAGAGRQAERRLCRAGHPKAYRGQVAAR